MSDVITVVEQQTVVVPGDTIQVVQTTSDSVIVENGDSGPQGPPGPQGLQGPQGPAGSGGDKNFTQPFLVSSTVTVTHNLGKYPAVTVIDSAGDEVIGDIDHLNINAFTISFAAPFSGTVYCN